MASHNVSWEDDDCNRIVQLSVDYQLVDNRIEIENVTPTSIQILNADKSLLRQIRVWTEKGRQLLSLQHAQRVGANVLREKIEAELGLSAVAS